MPKKKNHHPDSLIVTMIPLIPDYRQKHSGVTDEAMDTRRDNMLEEHKELLEMAERDLKILKNKRNKEEFGDRFSNSAVYKHVIYLGQLEGENSLKEAVNFMKERHKCENIKNLAINITAHGDPELIGTRGFKNKVDINPDNEMNGLATMANDYISTSVASSTNLSFYLLSCNSGYVSYSEDEEEYKKTKAVDKSFAGRFSKALAKASDPRDISVSGYRGYIGYDQGKLVASKSNISQITKSGQIADAEHVRFVFKRKDLSSNEVEVALPKGHSFKVENITKSLGQEEHFKHQLGTNSQSSKSEGKVASSIIDNREETNLDLMKVSVPKCGDSSSLESLDSKPEQKDISSISQVIMATFVLTVLLSIKLAQDKKNGKTSASKNISDLAKEVSNISSAELDELSDGIYKELSGSDDEISDEVLLNSSFAQGSNAAKLMTKRTQSAANGKNYQGR